MLLQWCSLKPSGPSSLAAIRFSAPSRLHSIRILPTGAKPFSQSPETVAQTVPDAFFLEIYFNAHPIHPADAKQKQKPPNALVPTMIAHAGGDVEYTVDMGVDFATRLMIVRGDFECVSMAIYGETVSDPPPPPISYTPTLLPVIEPRNIIPSLDPAKNSDPTAVAKQLLALIPQPPPLTLVIRLMFCLKPPNEDWDDPAFPHLYSDLDEDDMDIDLDSAFRCLSRPVADDIPCEPLERYAEKVADAIGPKDETQSYLVAGILCRAGSQNPEFAQTLLRSLDMEQIFDASNMDDITILNLLDAAANPDIAKHLDKEWFLEVLGSIQVDPRSDRDVIVSAQRLSSRLHEWKNFEDVLSNNTDNFAQAAQFMKDIASEEQSFGIWLDSVITHPDLMSKIQDTPAGTLLHPPLLLDSPLSTISHAEFIAFVKAFIGVASVLAVYAWSDSLPNDLCRKQTLSVLRFWQEIPGYREIVNYLLLLRQMSFRLECMTADNDPPTTCGIHAENIILNIASDPRSFLRHDFVKCILSLKQPLSLSYITEEQRVSMRRAAVLADDGLPAAVEELTGDDLHVIDLDRIRTLRVAILVIQQELQIDEDGDWTVLQSVWNENSQALVIHIIDILARISVELKRNSGISVLMCSSPELVLQLCEVSCDLIGLIIRLGPLSIATNRSIKLLTVAVADIFACTATENVSSSSSTVAQRTREACVDLLSSFISQKAETQVFIFRTLLEEGIHIDDQDPARHLLQLYALIDLLIPQPLLNGAGTNASRWVASVLPHVLPQLSAFFRALDVTSKVHLTDRLVNLDNGLIDIGEWLLLEELKHLLAVVRSLDSTMKDDHYTVVQHDAVVSLNFVADLMDSTSSTSSWAINAVCTTPELGQLLEAAMTSLLNTHLYSSHLSRVASSLAASPALSDSSLKCTVVATLLRSIQLQETKSTPDVTLTSALAVLLTIDEEHAEVDRLVWELGHALATITNPVDGISLDDRAATSIASALEWLAGIHHAEPIELPGISTDAWEELCDSLIRLTAPDRTSNLQVITAKFTPTSVIPALTLTIPDSLTLPVQTLKTLLQPPLAVPSTPKRKSPSQDVLGFVALSPPTALFRSPAVSGLTKTYTRNDFRELRQLPSARQNTSRLPSMHVDVGIMH
ncbi:hypothetical protein BJ138DRAFT_1198858 [Hygrophoropsis aurantiaca]|uniref:Uncharacterized protein n=1 Tax=Hygrophoropsis aurantiaca TaxID=72124 RepID=A0ACB8A8M1_9AGAM|nr:hypothetical protein BJ138DRAFT_1198858 [Hygrophoropsis aurantiaca]